MTFGFFAPKIVIFGKKQFETTKYQGVKHHFGDSFHLYVKRVVILHCKRNKPSLVSEISYLSKIHLNPCEIRLNQAPENSKKIKNSLWMQEIVDGYLLSDIMLLAILDGSYYKKSQQWLPWTYCSKYRLAECRNIDFWLPRWLATCSSWNVTQTYWCFFFCKSLSWIVKPW